MKGLTILEILVSISLLLLIATLTLTVMSSFGESSTLTEANSGVIGLLRDARARTMASQTSSNYGVHFENTQAVLFVGDSYDQASATNEEYLLPSRIEISDINLTGGSTNVVFTRLNGTTTASGTISLRARNNTAKTQTISIYSTGGIK
jgi:type II secretory pathway pseudopilin PulG